MRLALRVGILVRQVKPRALNASTPLRADPWLHEGEAPEAVDARATRITVELFDEGPRTRMVFVQRGFPTPESRDGHDEGWRSSFRQLDALLEAQP